jgi:carboxymethylenebutenolidase
MAMIELKASDGHTLSAYRAEPAGKPRGGLVVVQEIFGVNDHIKAVADGYARDGYLVIAPAVFDRIERNVDIDYSQESMQKGMQLKTAANADDALKDLQAAVDAAASAGKVGIVGFCWGGLLTWFASAKLTGLACAVPYYGGGMPDQTDVRPRVPVLAHFGEKDRGIPIDKVREFAAKKPEVEVHVYDAGHGFNCDKRQSFDPTASDLARSRTLEFLRKHVG